MKIHFIALIRGGREHQQFFEIIVNELKKFGEVTGEHIASPDLFQHGETSLLAKEILERETKNIENSDVIVAEATTPSLGVGYLLAKASTLNKKILVLYHGENDLLLSAPIKGGSNIKVKIYNSTENIKTILERYFQE